jgi:IS30 family transposase
VGELPEHLRRSIAWDRGGEMAKWRDVRLQLGNASLLLRSGLTLAARQERKQQPLLRFWFERAAT